jgi:hypothetical protein
MSKIWVFFAVVAIAASGARAQVINANSCSQSDVQSALNSVAADGTTVVVPSGSCTWTGNLNFSTAHSFTLQGHSTVTASDTHGNPTSFNDATLITDGQANSGGNSAILSIGLNGGSSQVVRMTGISWHGGGIDSEYNGDLTFAGGTGTRLRIDHNHFIDEADLAVSFYQPMSGVVDHNEFDVTSGHAWNGVRVYNTGGGGYGDEPWAAATNFGSGTYVYLENNTFNNGYANDCEDGGTYVARYNTLNTLATGQNIGFQGHATGSQPRGRGCRAWEVYNNWIGGGGGTVQYTVGYETSGTGVWWNNTVTNSGFDLDLTSDREGNNYSQTAAPSGWGYCGKGSNWDGNTVAAGYPCLDNPGRGKGDMLSGYWPNVQNKTSPGVSTGVWPHQAVEPVYMWMENFGGSNLVVTSSVLNNIQANRDYYAPVAGFNGTAGTGYGTYANIPSTCTAGPGGNTPGVAYWATDQHTLYVCTATNTWTAYYKPYAYPHPLVQPGSSTAGPASPTGLTGTVN